MTRPLDQELKLRDPHAAREAEKYARPIASRELILALLKEAGVPQSLDEIAERLALTDEEDITSLRRRLNAMERDGQLLKNRRDGYCVVNHRDLLSGRVIGHADGFGFLRPDDGGADLYISPKEMRMLMHDDRAVVCVQGVDRRGRREARVVEVLERNTQRLVGRLYTEQGISYVVPDNRQVSRDILIPEECRGDATPNQIVVVEIIEQPTRKRDPIGRVVQVIGDHMAPGMEIEVAIHSFGLPCEWPEPVLAEAAVLEGPNPENQDLHSGRVDIRDLPLVTIDGEDARDFDDALYCERTPKGWRLFVAIADVSYYVRPGTALDEEARRRGNSVYFPDRVIPMLPEVLSNGLCSLNPDEDRFCMVCEMSVGLDGMLLRSRFYSGLMRSKARLTYTEVARVLVDGDRALRRKRHALLPHLEELHALYKVLRRAREDRGALDFETQESRIVFGQGKKISEIVPTLRNDAHRLVEECMLIANMAAARHLARHKIPHPLRIHEGPSVEKLADLRAFLGRLGLSLDGGEKPEPKDYYQLTGLIAGRADEHLIQTVLLRSMAQAIYSPEPKGHFGLALESYAHFTSPIRRYPDLLVHRAIRHLLEGGTRSDSPNTVNEIRLLGEHCSFTERRADEATRDVVAWLKCEYMRDRLGETFDGVISAVTPFGFFVELKNIFIEGLVHISNLPRDYFHYDPVGYRLEGERTGTVYRLGDGVQVVVARVDLDERKIDLELAAADREEPARRTRKRKRRS